MKGTDLMNMTTEYPIDLVYLWCNDADEEWKTKKQKYLKKIKIKWAKRIFFNF